MMERGHVSRVSVWGLGEKKSRAVTILTHESANKPLKCDGAVWAWPPVQDGPSLLLFNCYHISLLGSLKLSGNFHSFFHDQICRSHLMLHLFRACLAFPPFAFVGHHRVCACARVCVLLNTCGCGGWRRWWMEKWQLSPWFCRDCHQSGY